MSDRVDSHLVICRRIGTPRCKGRPRTYEVAAPRDARAVVGRGAVGASGWIVLRARGEGGGVRPPDDPLGAGGALRDAGEGRGVAEGAAQAGLGAVLGPDVLE